MGPKEAPSTGDREEAGLSKGQICVMATALAFALRGHRGEGEEAVRQATAVMLLDYTE
jgi:hypothetical protein